MDYDDYGNLHHKPWKFGDNTPLLQRPHPTSQDVPGAKIQSSQAPWSFSRAQFGLLFLGWHGEKDRLQTSGELKILVDQILVHFFQITFFLEISRSWSPNKKSLFLDWKPSDLDLDNHFEPYPFWPSGHNTWGKKAPRVQSFRCLFFWLNRHVLRPDFHVEIRPHLNRDNWRIWHKAWNSYIYIYIAKFNPSFQQSPSFNVPNLLHDFLLLLTRIVLHPSLLRSSTVESNLSLGNIRQPLNLAINLQPK